jgi:3'-5' exoribonuclease
VTETPRNGPSIRSFRAGEAVTAFFVVRKKEMKTKKDGTPYLLFEFGDHTGRMSGTLWEGVQAVHSAVRTGDTVKVKGSVMEYNESLQIAVEKIRKTEPADGVDSKQFIRSENVDLDGQFRALTDKFSAIENPDIRRLLDAVFSNAEITERFREAPGGKLWHHAYLGGLAQHTAAVLAISERAASLYPHVVDCDLLTAGAVLHDIGKLDEFEYHRGFIEYSDRGRLFGHVALGSQRVTRIIGDLSAESPFPEELHRRIVHMILSHHGKLEQGAPVLPMTPEAMILHYADEMDSKVNALEHIIEKDKTGESRWSKYVQLLDRFIYLGE